MKSRIPPQTVPATDLNGLKNQSERKGMGVGRRMTFMSRPGGHATRSRSMPPAPAGVRYSPFFNHSRQPHGDTVVWFAPGNWDLLQSMRSGPSTKGRRQRAGEKTHQLVPVPFGGDLVVDREVGCGPAMKRSEVGLAAMVYSGVGFPTWPPSCPRWRACSAAPGAEPKRCGAGLIVCRDRWL